MTQLLIKKSNFLTMDVIYIMIVVSLIIALLFFILFLRTVKTGQYDDVYTPSVRMLFDDEIVIENKKEKSETIIKYTNN